MNSVYHVVASVNAQIGGPAVSVPALSDALNTLHCTSSVWSNNYPELGSLPIMHSTLHSFPISRAGKVLRGVNAAMYRSLERAVASKATVHSHGLWMSPNRYARLVAKTRKAQLVVSPRGMLEDWSRSFHSYRKRIVWQLAEKENLAYASGFHATSTAEAKSIQSLGLTQPVAIIPNGIHQPPIISEHQRLAVLQNLQLDVSRRYCLFLSRIHPKKGLQELLASWRILSDIFPEWTLLVVGPDLSDYWKKVCLSEVQAATIPNMLYLGNRSGTEKEVLFSIADLFVLPSFSENFGIVIGEALARGVPVVTTPYTPWKSIVSEDIGWICQPSIDDLVATLRNCLSETPTTLQERGQKGAAFVKANFSWDKIARSMLNFYNHLQDRTVALDCLYKL